MWPLGSIAATVLRIASRFLPTLRERDVPVEAVVEGDDADRLLVVEHVDRRLRGGLAQLHHRARHAPRLVEDDDERDFRLVLALERHRRQPLDLGLPYPGGRWASALAEHRLAAGDEQAAAVVLHPCARAPPSSGRNRRRARRRSGSRRPTARRRSRVGRQPRRRAHRDVETRLLERAAADSCALAGVPSTYSTRGRGATSDLARQRLLRRKRIAAARRATASSACAPGLAKRDVERHRRRAGPERQPADSRALARPSQNSTIARPSAAGCRTTTVTRRGRASGHARRQMHGVHPSVAEIARRQRLDEHRHARPPPVASRPRARRRWSPSRPRTARCAAGARARFPRAPRSARARDRSPAARRRRRSRSGSACASARSAAVSSSTVDVGAERDDPRVRRPDVVRQRVDPRGGVLDRAARRRCATRPRRRRPTAATTRARSPAARARTRAAMSSSDRTTACSALLARIEVGAAGPQRQPHERHGRKQPQRGGNGPGDAHLTP